MPALGCFTAYDVRGRLGDGLDERVARRIGRAFVQALAARTVVVGRDNRASSAALMAALVEGITEAGADVLDLGLCGTEEMYFATSHFGTDGGIEVTASHNPMDYNGMKLVGRASAPLDSATGLARIRALAEMDEATGGAEDGRGRRPRGSVRPAAGARDAYVARVLSFVEVAALRPLRILVNAGNGAAGPTFDAIAAALAARGAPLAFVRLNHVPDGGFPNGIPNPLLPENRPATAAAVVAAGADFGVAWDGDFDRCFFFDASGGFVPGEYVVGLLAEAFLARAPGAVIVHDPRVVWNVRDVVAAAGGRPHQARTGHVFLKQAMRDTGAVYGGEMSAHHYFRDFAACDSGMIPLLLIAELVSRRSRSLAEMLAARMAAFPSSGEINFRLRDPAAALARVRAALEPEAVSRGRERRAEPRLRKLALQPACVEHRAAAQAERRGARRRRPRGARGGAGAGIDRRLTPVLHCGIATADSPANRRLGWNRREGRSSRPDRRAQLPQPDESHRPGARGRPHARLACGERSEFLCRSTAQWREIARFLDNIDANRPRAAREPHSRVDLCSRTGCPMINVRHRVGWSGGYVWRTCRSASGAWSIDQRIAGFVHCADTLEQRDFRTLRRARISPLAFGARPDLAGRVPGLMDVSRRWGRGVLRRGDERRDGA